MYDIQIRNGVTIIATGTTGNEVKNKTGFVGITHYKQQNRYRAELTIKRKKYLLGFFRNIEEAKAIRQEAERQKEAGTFFEWYESLEKYQFQKLSGKEKKRIQKGN